MKTFEHFQDIPETVEIMDISKNPLGCNCNTWNSLSQLHSNIDDFKAPSDICAKKFIPECQKSQSKNSPKASDSGKVLITSIVASVLTVLVILVIIVTYKMYSYRNRLKQNDLLDDPGRHFDYQNIPTNIRESMDSSSVLVI